MAFLGIDLGTTFSAMAYMGSGGQPVTIPNAEGELTTPSVILFESQTEVVIGREAKRAALAEPAKTVLDVKRYMGEPFYPKPIFGKRLSPVSLSALILKKMAQDAQRQVGPIEGAVITVPAYFDDGRRQATADAGRIAGLRVLDIINEPTAAALVYAIRDYASSDQSVRGRSKPALASGAEKIAVVYDLGGGTFDVTVLKLLGRNLTVLATGGDVSLGGRDWDARIADHMAQLFIDEHGIDPRADAFGEQQIMLAAEEAKKDLSRRKKTRFVVSTAGKSITGEMTREEASAMTNDLLFRTESRLNRALRDAGVKWDAVTELLAVGGSTRMPQVVEMLRRVSGKEPNTSLSPDEAVAHGAAIHAATCVVQGRGTHIGRTPLKPAAPADPAAKAAPAAPQTAGPGEEPIEEETRQRFLGRLGQAVRDLLGSVRTTNVNSHTLGLVATDKSGQRKVIPMIPRNTPLPAEVVRCCGTVSPNQARITVHIVEGESDKADDCIPVGACQVTGLPKGLPKGSPVEIRFIYDSSGRLHVEVLHVATGVWAQTTIERNCGVDQSRIQISRNVIARLSIS